MFGIPLLRSDSAQKWSEMIKVKQYSPKESHLHPVSRQLFWLKPYLDTRTRVSCTYFEGQDSFWTKLLPKFLFSVNLHFMFDIQLPCPISRHSSLNISRLSTCVTCCVNESFCAIAKCLVKSIQNNISVGAIMLNLRLLMLKSACLMVPRQSDLFWGLLSSIHPL